jgi:hypothetical protein
MNHGDAEMACGNDVYGNVDEDISDTDDASDAEDTFGSNQICLQLLNYLPT